MLDCRLALLEDALPAYLCLGEIAQPQGSRHPEIAPFQVYTTHDGYIVIAAGNDHLFDLLAKALGRPDLLENPDYKTNALRRAHDDLLEADMERTRRKRTTREWLDVLNAASVPCGPVNELPRGTDPLQYSDPLERLLRVVATFPGPVIAMVHGTVWGGATDLVLSCDLILGDETCSFAITPANLGLAYNTAGLVHFLRRLPLNLVKEMFFTAAPVKAEDAARWGILNHLVPAADLETGDVRAGAPHDHQGAPGPGHGEGAVASPGGGNPSYARDIRTGSGIAATSLSERGLPGRTSRLPRETPTGLHGQVAHASCYPPTLSRCEARTTCPMQIQKGQGHATRRSCSGHRA